MQRVPDAVTSIFHLDTKDKILAACLKGNSAGIVYSEQFGLGWRFGLQYAKRAWIFARVNVYLDHTHCIPETDTAAVTVCLKDGSAAEGPSFDKRTVSIASFGYGPPALLGSFSPSRIIAHPYLGLTVTAKVKIVQAIADPLSGTASALRQSMNDGTFIDTKYYAISKHSGNAGSPAKTRALYANHALLSQDVDIWQLGPLPRRFSSFVVLHIVTCLLLPSICAHISYPSQCFLLLVHFLASITWWLVRRRAFPLREFFAALSNGQTTLSYTDCLLMEYQSESSLTRDVEQLDYELDSDFDEEEEDENAKEGQEGREASPSTPLPYNPYLYSLRTAPILSDSDVSDTASSSALSSDDNRDDLSSTVCAVGSLPPDSGSTDTLVPEPLSSPPPPAQRMVLVRNTAFPTWASYVYYCYTGQVSFYPLKSKDPYSRRDKTIETPRCSPKSMYRLAVKLKHTRLEALAFQAIKSNLSESNILDEAFSQFTAHYPDIRQMELEFLLKFRSAVKVAVPLQRIVDAVAQGEMPHARAMLHAFLRLTRPEAGGTQ
ncbi:hypothetical protein BDR04DRAFT_1048223 [Suillus decipiens]|nr:hypothetical protein BDR04DRAFT_1048223 [Suillus decipiens]